MRQKFTLKSNIETDMAMNMELFKDWKLYLVFTVALFLIIAFGSPNLSRNFDSGDTDTLEYQTVAINLYKYHHFPVIGFMADVSNYKIDTNVNWGFSGSLRFREIVSNKPIIDMGKPPLYYLLLTSLYEITGYQICSVRLLNIFIVCFIAVFQVYMGFRLLEVPGIFIGIFSGIVYYILDSKNVYNIYPNYIVDLFIFLAYLISTNVRFRSSFKYDFLVGLLMACMVLTNGNVMFVPIIYFLWAGYKHFLRAEGKRFMIQVASFLVPVLTWAIFANVAFNNARPEREAYLAKLNSEMVPILVDVQPFLNAPRYSHTDTLVWTFIIKKLMSFCIDDGVILLSKQPYGNEIYGAHNELCFDGRWHPEWRVMRNLYYNAHPTNESIPTRIFSYYAHHPGVFFRNMAGKVHKSTDSLSPIYYLSVILLGLLTITSFGPRSFKWGISIIILGVFFFLPFPYQMALFFFMFLTYNFGFFALKWADDVPWMIPIVLNNALLITMVTIGEPRYIQCLDGIIIPGCVFLVVKLYKQLSLA